MPPCHLFKVPVRQISAMQQEQAEAVICAENVSYGDVTSASTRTPGIQQKQAEEVNCTKNISYNDVTSTQEKEYAEIWNIIFIHSCILLAEALQRYMYSVLFFFIVEKEYFACVQ